MTREAGAAFIVNDDSDLALLTGADGGTWREDLPVEAVRALRQPGHRPPRPIPRIRPVRQCPEARITGVGPISRPGPRRMSARPWALNIWTSSCVISIRAPCRHRGIKEHNLKAVDHGARCMALVTEITAAEDIRSKIAALTNILCL